MDHLQLLGARDTAVADDSVVSFDCVEATVEKRLVDECPQVLGGLQLRANDERPSSWAASWIRAGLPRSCVEFPCWRPFSLLRVTLGTRRLPI
jgi:hypothetical protein